MRPCEVRAGIELSKLGQVNTGNLVLATWDCPGAVPIRDYLDDRDASEELYGSLTGMPTGGTRSTCASCTDFVQVDSDIHLGCFGIPDGDVIVIPRSSRGAALLEGTRLGETDPLHAQRTARIDELTSARTEARSRLIARMDSEVKGFDGMLDFFSDCIACHNCQSACPICYCRMCYFDSEVAKSDPEAHVDTAVKRGGISMPADRLMFHTGRMVHMSLSCVSCGQCSDVCPADIPVAEVFCFAADASQRAFEYRAGSMEGEPLPLRQFRESELPGIHEMVKDADEEVHHAGSAEAEQEPEAENNE
jgi:formate dehydrogenase subunit beta